MERLFHISVSFFQSLLAGAITWEVLLLAIYFIHLLACEPFLHRLAIISSQMNKHTLLVIFYLLGMAFVCYYKLTSVEAR